MSISKLVFIFPFLISTKKLKTHTHTHNYVSEARCITSSADRTAKGVDKEK